MDIIIFIFTDETYEIYDESSSSTISTGQKNPSWAAQVEIEQQQEADDSTDNISQTNTLPKDAGERGRRRGRKRNKSLLVKVCLQLISVLSFLFYRYN